MIVYATDEDIAVFTPSEFSSLCPRDQLRVVVVDGAFNSADRWTLISATTDFAAAGVAAGHVAVLAGPTPPFSSVGELFGVASVGLGSLDLRRLGMAERVGQPPAPPTGISGVTVLVPTFAPQIAMACESLNNRLGIGSSSVGLSPAALAAGGELREATVLWVLQHQYASLSSRPADGFAVKAVQTGRELERCLSGVISRWASGVGLGAGRFGTRVSR